MGDAFRALALGLGRRVLSLRGHRKSQGAPPSALDRWETLPSPPRARTFLQPCVEGSGSRREAEASPGPVSPLGQTQCPQGGLSGPTTAAGSFRSVGKLGHFICAYTPRSCPRGQLSNRRCTRFPVKTSVCPDHLSPKNAHVYAHAHAHVRTCTRPVAPPMAPTGSRVT